MIAGACAGEFVSVNGFNLSGTFIDELPDMPEFLVHVPYSTKPAMSSDG